MISIKLRPDEDNRECRVAIVIVFPLLKFSKKKNSKKKADKNGYVPQEASSRDHLQAK